MRSVGRNLRIVLTELWTEADVEEEDERAVREEREEVGAEGWTGERVAAGFAARGRETKWPSFAVMWPMYTTSRHSSGEKGYMLDRALCPNPQLRRVDVGKRICPLNAEHELASFGMQLTSGDTI